ncbi:globin-3-like [Liolophura sinensis]|uniref:globin-3-like n=1 Tax=Liolophura sinensis TaxID=3198878 RepID=UPI003158C556
MGCVPSSAKVAHEDVDDMADSLPEPAPPAPTDPRLPLTARQVFKLKKSWKGIKRNMELTGVEMFIRLFKINSDLKRLFSNFKDLDSEDALRENEALEKHALLVMSTMDEAISNIDNVDYVYDVLNRVGQSHGRFSGFVAELFQWMEIPFLESVQLTLGDRYSENMDVIYKITIKFILKTVQSGYSADIS